MFDLNYSYKEFITDFQNTNYSADSYQGGQSHAHCMGGGHALCILSNPMHDLSSLKSLGSLAIRVL